MANKDHATFEELRDSLSNSASAKMCLQKVNVLQCHYTSIPAKYTAKRGKIQRQGYLIKKGNEKYVSQVKLQRIWGRNQKLLKK